MAAHLPSESALRRARGDGWSTTERLLASIEFSLRVLRWQPTKDGHDGKNQPEMLPSPAELARMERERDEYTQHDMDEIAEMLGIPEDRR